MDKGILGTSTPQSLLNAVFYLNGKSFCLRGGEEHRRLCISQLVREYNPDRYVYTEAGSKNKKGTFMEMHIQNKVVPICSSPQVGERCHVHVLDFYLSKLPKDAIDRDIFYLRPLPAVPAKPAAPWFQSVPIGRNQLAKMVPNMCSRAGTAGHKTNHSLRATAATDLYHANIPEKLIQERTGHKSVQALRVYQHTTDDQQKAVSEVLASTIKQSSLQVKDSHNYQPHVQSVCRQQPIVNIQGCTVNISMTPPQLQALHPPPPTPAMPDVALEETELYAS